MNAERSGVFIKVHLDDSDNYECDDNGGVDIYFTNDQIIKIFRAGLLL